MIAGGSQLFSEVLDQVEYWIPDKAYGHERKFQSELQDVLDHRLNEAKSSDPFGLESGGDHVVSTERGKSYADIAVDDLVGIELKRNLSNSQTKKLRGQIEDYLDNYPYVIVCACGIDDMDGWRELKNKYEGQVGMGLENGGEVAFVHKEKENYGKNPSEVKHNSGGFLGGDSLL